MAPLTKLFAFFAILPFTLASAQAQNGWDRAVHDVHIVHPPGTPPGRYEIHVDILNGVDDTTAPGSDLSEDVTVSLNGVPINVTTINVTPLQVIQCIIPMSGGQCDLGNSCGSWLYMGNLYPGICNYIPPPINLGCTCWDPHDYIPFIPNGFYVPTDVITIGLTASPGSLPEFDTSDDNFTIQVGEHNPGTPFCSGDGTLPILCPCGNSGAPGHGCANSVNTSGALLEATGFTEVDPMTGTDAVVLHGSGMPTTSSAIYLKGDVSNGGGIVFGDGVRCVDGNLIRLRTKVNVGGASKFPEAGDPSLSVRGATPPGSGLTGYYQVYYRNAAGAFCPPATFNVSNGTILLW